jgi:hypothetical protein
MWNYIFGSGIKLHHNTWNSKKNWKHKLRKENKKKRGRIIYLGRGYHLSPLGNFPHAAHTLPLHRLPTCGVSSSVPRRVPGLASVLRCLCRPGPTCQRPLYCAQAPTSTWSPPWPRSPFHRVVSTPSEIAVGKTGSRSSALGGKKPGLLGLTSPSPLTFVSQSRYPKARAPHQDICAARKAPSHRALTIVYCCGGSSG